MCARERKRERHTKTYIEYHWTILITLITYFIFPCYCHVTMLTTPNKFLANLAGSTSLGLLPSTGYTCGLNRIWAAKCWERTLWPCGRETMGIPPEKTGIWYDTTSWAINNGDLPLKLTNTIHQKAKQLHCFNACLCVFRASWLH